MEALSIIDAVLGRCPGAASALDDGSGSRARFLAAFASASRLLRRADLCLSGPEAEALRRAGLAAPETLTPADFLRARLLLSHLAELPAPDHAALVAELVQTGDNQERQAVLKCLMLLPDPFRFLDTAIDAVRAVVADTVAAVACDNDYPARFFPIEAFRAMVLKALHMGLPLGRVRGLEQRRDAEMTRMGNAYASEQRAAQRPVSPDFLLMTGERP